VAEHQEPSQLIGEFLREVAVLVFVFYPLEGYLYHQLTLWRFLLIISLCCLLLWRGIMLEGKQNK